MTEPTTRLQELLKAAGMNCTCGRRLHLEGCGRLASLAACDELEGLGFMVVGDEWPAVEALVRCGEALKEAEVLLVLAAHMYRDLGDTEAELRYFDVRDGIVAALAAIPSKEEA